MSRIVVDPEQLRSLSVRLRSASGEVEGLGNRIGGIIGGLDWEVRQQANVEGAVARARRMASSLASQLEEMSRFLEIKAQLFAEADGQPVEIGISWRDFLGRLPPWLRPHRPFPRPLPWRPFQPRPLPVPLVVGGAVGGSVAVRLMDITGIAGRIRDIIERWKQQQQQEEERANEVTREQLEARYEQASWGEVFRAEEQLSAHIGDLEDRISGLQEQEKRLMEEQPHGSIWRRAAWELERARRLAELRAERHRLKQELTQARMEYEVVQERIDAGIPPGNPQPWGAGCVRYASSKRYLSPEDFAGSTGPAYWDQPKYTEKYETGSIPVKGAFLIMDGPELAKQYGAKEVNGVNAGLWKDIDGKTYAADATYGHVMYVENVEPLGDGTYKVTVSDPVYPGGVTFHIDPNTLSDAVWFLYDKKPA